MLKRSLLAIMILISCCAYAQQDVVSKFKEKSSGRMMELTYTYKVNGNVPMNGSGELKLQGDCFIMKGDGLEIYCDGKTRWTVDTGAEECYIETLNNQGLGLESNPALLLGTFDKEFAIKKNESASFQGQTATKISLTPTNNGTGIDGASLFFDSSSTPLGAAIELGKGYTMTITIKKFKTSAAIDRNAFSFKSETLGKDYVTTDLR